MIDPRFYEALGPVTVRALAPSGEIGGDADRLVSGLASSEQAGPGDLCFFEPKGKNVSPLATAPAACVVAPALAHLAPKAGALILSDRPRAVFARLRSLAAELPGDLFEGGAPRLSMGMSGDFEIAIEEGAHDVRIGTLLFEGLSADLARGRG